LCRENSDIQKNAYLAKPNGYGTTRRTLRCVTATCIDNPLQLSHSTLGFVLYEILTFAVPSLVIILACARVISCMCIACGPVRAWTGLARVLIYKNPSTVALCKLFDKLHIHGI